MLTGTTRGSECVVCSNKNLGSVGSYRLQCFSGDQTRTSQQLLTIIHQVFCTVLRLVAVLLNQATPVRVFGYNSMILTVRGPQMFGEAAYAHLLIHSRSLIFIQIHLSCYLTSFHIYLNL